MVFSVSSEEIKAEIAKFLENSDKEIITFKGSADHVYEVEIDSITGVTIEECTVISRHINSLYPDDDYELTVASYSISSPFIAPIQYQKNIGRAIEILTTSGEKLRGELTTYSGESFTIEFEAKVEVEGKKRKELQIMQRTLMIADTKSVRLSF